jgi:hypothetical protein
MTTEPSIIADPLVGRAVSSIVPNSDQQFGIGILESTLVDLGILGQLEANNNQILFGRRGTGKSHILRLLTARRNELPGHAAIFIDLRRLGSAQLMANTDKPLLPTSRISLKIASLQYDSNLSISLSGSGKIGFSFGCEINRSIDLDETYERNVTVVEETFTDLLFRHLMANISDPDHLASKYGVIDAASLRFARQFEG